MSSVEVAYAVLFAMSLAIGVTHFLKHKKEIIGLKMDMSEAHKAQHELQYRMTTERVVREKEFDDNFCRTCNAVVRPAGHFCYSCGMPYPLKKDTK